MSQWAANAGAEVATTQRGQQEEPVMADEDLMM